MGHPGPAHFICHAPAGPAAVLLHLQPAPSGAGTMSGSSSPTDTDSNASTLILNGITTPDHMLTQQLNQRFLHQRCTIALHQRCANIANDSNATSPMLPLSEPTSNNEALVVLPIRDSAPDQRALSAARATAYSEAMAREPGEQLVIEMLEIAAPSPEAETRNPAGVVEQRSPDQLTPLGRPAVEMMLARAEMANEDWLGDEVLQQRPLEVGTSQADLCMFMHLQYLSQSRSRMYRDAASVMGQDDEDAMTLRGRADLEDRLAERALQVWRRAREISFEVAEAHLQSKGNPCPCLIYHHT